MKVVMLVSTAYKGFKKVGEEVDIPSDFADRWIKNGIAKFLPQAMEEVLPTQTQELVQEPIQEQKAEPAQEPVLPEAVDYSTLKAIDLYKLCIEKGLTVEQKLSKEAYIAQLNALATL